MESGSIENLAVEVVLRKLASPQSAPLRSCITPNMRDDVYQRCIENNAMSEDELCKPRACRLYPFSVEPTPDGRYKYLLSLERGHHFKGGQVQSGRWMKHNFLPEDREFMRMDMSFAPIIALLLGKVPDAERKRAIIMYLWYKFSDYDLGKPFLEQYRKNISSLISQLQRLAGTEGQNGR